MNWLRSKTIVLSVHQSSHLKDRVLNYSEDYQFHCRYAVGTIPEIRYVLTRRGGWGGSSGNSGNIMTMLMSLIHVNDLNKKFTMN